MGSSKAPVKLPTDNIIRFWEHHWIEHRFLMEPSTKIMVEETIKRLKQLKDSETAKEGYNGRE